jgi:hypothetical protein
LPCPPFLSSPFPLRPVMSHKLRINTAKNPLRMGLLPNEIL